MPAILRWLQRPGGHPRSGVHGKTGILVPFEPVSNADPEPLRPEQFMPTTFAAAINELLRAPERRQAMGPKPRRRV